jgi:hypothetical protein
MAHGLGVRILTHGFRPTVDTLCQVGGEWGARWAFGDPRADELDPIILLWWMRRRIALDRIPRRRVLIEFDSSGGRQGGHRSSQAPPVTGNSRYGVTGGMACSVASAAGGLQPNNGTSVVAPKDHSAVPAKTPENHGSPWIYDRPGRSGAWR